MRAGASGSRWVTDGESPKHTSPPNQSELDHHAVGVRQPPIGGHRLYNRKRGKPKVSHARRWGGRRGDGQDRRTATAWKRISLLDQQMSNRTDRRAGLNPEWPNAEQVEPLDWRAAEGKNAGGKTRTEDPVLAATAIDLWKIVSCRKVHFLPAAEDERRKSRTYGKGRCQEGWVKQSDLSEPASVPPLADRKAKNEYDHRRSRPSHPKQRLHLGCLTVLKISQQKQKVSR